MNKAVLTDLSERLQSTLSALPGGSVDTKSMAGKAATVAAAGRLGSKVAAQTVTEQVIPAVRDVVTDQIMPVVRETVVPAVTAAAGTVADTAADYGRAAKPHVVAAGKVARARGAAAAAGLATGLAGEHADELSRRSRAVLAAAGGQQPARRWRPAALGLLLGAVLGAVAARLVGRRSAQATGAGVVSAGGSSSSWQTPPAAAPAAGASDLTPGGTPLGATTGMTATAGLPATSGTTGTPATTGSTDEADPLG
jgi:hypothetical protein